MRVSDQDPVVTTTIPAQWPVSSFCREYQRHQHRCLQNQYGGGGIYLDTKFATAARTVTLTNSNAGENDWVGVWIWSRGNITLNNVSANDNHTEAGIHVDNCRDYDPEYPRRRWYLFPFRQYPADQRPYPQQ